MGENNSGEDIILTSAEISPLFSPATNIDTTHLRYKQYNVV
jgi:hypothetical protein